MNGVVSFIRAEPVALMTLIQVSIALGTAFGLDLTQVQEGALLAFTAAVLGLVARTSVTANSTAQAATATSAATGVDILKKAP